MARMGPLQPKCAAACVSCKWLCMHALQACNNRAGSASLQDPALLCLAHACPALPCLLPSYSQSMSHMA